MTPWERSKPDTVQKVGWRTLVTKSFVMPNGNVEEFTVVGENGSVACCVLAITKDKKIVVAKQFRPGPEKYMFDIPGGYGEPGETLEETALRELQEETGYTTPDIQYLGKVYKSAYLNTTYHFFIAYNCEQTTKTSLDEHEFINIELLTVEQFQSVIKSALTTDSEIAYLAYDQLEALKQ